MNVLRLAILSAAALWPLAGVAQTPLTLSSSAEMSWTSNAEGAAGGSGDWRLTDSHTIGLEGGDGTVGLRASLGFEQTRYQRLWQHNEWAATAGLEADVTLAPNARLRGKFGLAYGEEGKLMATLLGPLGAVTPTLSAHAGLRLDTMAGTTGIGLSLGLEAVRPGQTRLEAGLAPPARLKAETLMASAGVELTHPFGPHATLAALAEWRGLLVGADDQAIYGRLPLNAVRLALGGQTGDGAVASLGLRGGIDVLLPAIAGLEAAILPYGRAEAELAVLPGLTLRASLAAGADLADPADLYADWRLSGRAGLVLALMEGLEIEPSLFASQRRSAGLDVTIETEQGAALALRYGWGHLGLAANLSHRRVTALAGPYDESRVGLRVDARL